MKVSDLISGAFFALMGVGIFLKATTFPVVSGQDVPPSVFPMVVGGAMAFVGLFIVIKAVAAGELRPLVVRPEWVGSFRGTTGFVLVLLAVVFFIAAADYIGFIPTTFIILLGIQVWLRGKVLSAIVVAFVGSLVFYSIFAIALHVPLQSSYVEYFIDSLLYH